MAPYTYDWLPNVSSTSNASGLSAGNYQIAVTDQNLDQLTINYTINEPLVLGLTMPLDTTICPGDSLVLNTQVSGGTFPYLYSWDNTPNLSGLNINDPLAFPASTEIFILSISDSSGCTIQDSLEVSLFNVPAPSFITDVESGCQPLQVTFVNTTGGTALSCTWNYGDGNTSNWCPGGSYVYNDSGVFDVSLTVVSVEGCVATHTMPGLVNVIAQPLIDAGPDLNVCIGDLVALMADNPNNASLSWNNGVTDGGYFSPTSDNYYVVEANLSGCVNIDSMFMDVNTVYPTVDIGRDYRTCDSIETLIGPSGMDGYLWSNSDTTVYTYITMTSFYILTVDSAGCSNSDTIYVSFEDCAGIEENDISEFISVYPNPASESLNIDFNSKAQSFSQFKIYNLLGSVLMEGVLESEKNMLIISQLKAGFYILELFESESGKFAILKFEVSKT